MIDDRDGRGRGSDPEIPISKIEISKYVFLMFWKVEIFHRDDDLGVWTRGMGFEFGNPHLKNQKYLNIFPNDLGGYGLRYLFFLNARAINYFDICTSLL